MRAGFHILPFLFCAANFPAISQIKPQIKNISILNFLSFSLIATFVNITLLYTNLGGCELHKACHLALGTLKSWSLSTPIALCQNVNSLGPGYIIEPLYYMKQLQVITGSAVSLLLISELQKCLAIAAHCFGALIFLAAPVKEHFICVFHEILLRSAAAAFFIKRAPHDCCAKIFALSK